MLKKLFSSLAYNQAWRVLHEWDDDEAITPRSLARRAIVSEDVACRVIADAMNVCEKLRKLPKLPPNMV